MKFKQIRYIIYIFFLLFFLFFYFFLVNPIIFPIKKNNVDFWVSKSNLYNHVYNITNYDFHRTYDNLVVLDEVANYIYDNFVTNWCHQTEFQKYLVDWKEYKNVICKFNWLWEKIIIGWHYDAYWEYSKNIDGKIVFWIYPWADDNASAVSWLLELSRVISINNLNKNIELVAYTLEEPPYFDSENMWSYIHAKQLKENKEDIKFMLCLEMIWYFTDEEIQDYQIKFLERFYPKKWNFIAVVWELFDFNIYWIKKSMIENSDIVVKSLSSPKFIPWVDFSDHRNYWLFWYKAYMITDTSFFRNKNYHTINDTIDTLNFDKMKEVIDWIYWILLTN